MTYKDLPEAGPRAFWSQCLQQSTGFSNGRASHALGSGPDLHLDHHDPAPPQIKGPFLLLFFLLSVHHWLNHLAFTITSDEQGIDLDSHLQKEQKAESQAYISLVEDKLHESLVSCIFEPFERL